MTPISRTIALAISLGLSANASAQDSAAEWYRDGAITAKNATGTTLKSAKNVILFVGDGMGISTLTAARILDGQSKGGSGEENRLSFETFPWTALSKTYSVDGQTPDSAPTMTAMVSGVKTNQGIMGVDQSVAHNDCASASGHNVVSLLELAEIAGMSTGIVSTARITHATPAATFAHTPNRDWESDANLTDEARSNGCKDIAAQLLDLPFGNGVEVALGGGRSRFLPETTDDPENAGRRGERKDGRNLTQEWTASAPNAAYVWNQAQFEAIDPATTLRLLGLFERSHMQYEADRANDIGGEPSLTEMTTKSIDMLSRNPKGYFLMVEAGRIDHGHHAGNAHRALTDTIALSEAVAEAVARTNPEDTLIVVTADHSHVFTVSGYPDRGNPILGLVKEGGQLATDLGGLPYTTLAYANGPGYRGPDVRPDLSDVDTSDKDFLQESIVPLPSETHSAEDVGIYASGPGAQTFHGVIEQNVIYHAIAQNTAGLQRALCRGQFFCSLVGQLDEQRLPSYDYYLDR